MLGVSRPADYGDPRSVVDDSSPFFLLSGYSHIYHPRFLRPNVSNRAGEE